MLQQTTVRTVVPRYGAFLRRFPTLGSMAKAPLDEVLAAWSGLGYYRRARHLHAAARIVLRTHGGRFPDRMDAAIALPGIGRYTAGAILSIAFGQPHPVVDGNVSRVLSRLHHLRGIHGRPASVARLWGIATGLIAFTDSPGDLNQALMELGATVCTPRQPACPACPLGRVCLARARGVQELIPPPRRRPAPRTTRVQVALVSRAGRLLLCRRRGTTVMDGLWEFPVLGDDGSPATAPAARGARAGHAERAGQAGRRIPVLIADHRLRIRAGRTIASVRHTIMERRYVVIARRARLLAPPPRGSCRWVRPDAIPGLPTSSLVGKILKAFSV